MGGRVPAHRAVPGPVPLEIQAAVHLATVAHHSDGDRAGGVVHVVDDPVVAHPGPQPRPVSLRAAGSSWRKALRARGRASTAYSIIQSVSELGFEFVERDRLAGLVPGGVSLGGVFGVFRGA